MNTTPLIGNFSPSVTRLARSRFRRMVCLGLGLAVRLVAQDSEDGLAEARGELKRLGEGLVRSREQLVALPKAADTRAALVEAQDLAKLLLGLHLPGTASPERGVFKELDGVEQRLRTVLEEREERMRNLAASPVQRDTIERSARLLRERIEEIGRMRREAEATRLLVEEVARFAEQALGVHQALHALDAAHAREALGKAARRKAEELDLPRSSEKFPALRGTPPLVPAGSKRTEAPSPWLRKAGSWS